MAQEPRRKCGYRKVGGLYLVSRAAGVPCDRLPILLTVCPCCSQGFKQARGFTWVDVNLLVQGVHEHCHDSFPCPLCMATPEMGKCGMLWIGEKFYPSPAVFMREAGELGISRRIPAIPRNFKLGETWILLAHAKGAGCPDCCGAGLAPAVSAAGPTKCATCAGSGKVPGVFHVFRPHAIEQIITEAQAKDPAFMQKLAAKGITPVTVPDNDPDHQGSVYDDAEPVPEKAPDEGV